MNYPSITLFYNSHLINFGAWANDSWPGWTSPGGNLLPEPVVFIVPAYTCLGFAQVMFMVWLLRKANVRWPAMGFWRTVAVIIAGLTITDTIIEGAVIRTGLYAYPGGIRALTLFAGQTYQVPMTEPFFFAVFGAVHLAFAVLYMAPNQWLSTHSDPFPRGYPSYLVNGMCLSGADGKTCPGPGVPMPRPANNPF